MEHFHTGYLGISIDLDLQHERIFEIRSLEDI